MPSWHSLVGNAAALVADRAITLLRGRVATSVRVRSISLRFESAQAGYLIRAVYRLDSDQAEDRRTIAIDCRDAALTPIALRLSGTGGADQGAPTLPIHSLDLAPNERTWSGAIVHATFRWEPSHGSSSIGKGSQVLVLPDALPRLLDPIRQAPPPDRSQARLTITDQLPSGLAVAGMRAVGGPAANEQQEYLQLGILERRSSWEGEGSAHGRVILTGEMAAGLSTTDRRRVTDVVNKSMAFLIGRLGQVAATDVVVNLAKPMDIGPTILGLCLTAEPRWFGLSADPEQLHGMSIVQHLTSIWLGVGCRITGPYRVPLVLGIGAAMGLILLDALGEPELVQQTLQRYQQFEPPDAGAAPVGAAHLVRVVTGGLFACAMAKPGCLRRLRAFIGEQWGSVLAPEELIAVLRAMGVDLPERLMRDSR